jgi:hypothetical protein
LGTIKDTTGTTVGSVANTGATVVTQNKTVAFNDAALSSAANAFVVPAGSQINNVLLYTGGFTGTGTITITVKLGSTTIATATLTSATASAGALTLTAAAFATLSNTGTTDQFLTYTFAATTLTAGTGSLICAYTVRNSDGAYRPASA